MSILGVIFLILGTRTLRPIYLLFWMIISGLVLLLKSFCFFLILHLSNWQFYIENFSLLQIFIYSEFLNRTVIKCLK